MTGNGNENYNFWIQRKMPGTNWYLVYWKDHQEIGIVREHDHTQMRFYLNLTVSRLTDPKNSDYEIYSGESRRITMSDSLHEIYNFIPVAAEVIRQSQTFPITHKDNPIQKYWKASDGNTIRDVLRDYPRYTDTGDEHRINMHRRFSIHQLESKLSKIRNSFYNTTMLDFMKTRHWLENLDDYLERYAS